MRRRDFIILVSGGVAAWPLGALRSQSRQDLADGVYRTGIRTFTTRYSRAFGDWDTRRAGSQPLSALCRRPRGSFPEFASEMVRLKVDIIIVTTTPAALAVKECFHPIPVVFPTLLVPSRAGWSQPCAPRRQCHGGASSDSGSQHKTSGDTQGSGAWSVARSGSLECGQPRNSHTRGEKSQVRLTRSE